jgi:hypothetical protein
MANKNPIFLDTDADLTEYNIPANFSDTMIYLTVKVELLEKGWQFASSNSIFLGQKNLYPEKTPEPIDLKLDYGKNLKGKKISIGAHISRFRNGNDNVTPCKVRYHLIFEAGDTLLDEFTKDSDTNNPSDFDSFILFKI